ncbi:hypothetical protein ONZ45_g12873 [Pleurotus djamor]|nr:hypothetical protein ONZ45_g12873 [Pleurotus djamor]
MHLPSLYTILSGLSNFFLDASVSGPSTSLVLSPSPCVEPAVRKEWRALSPGEQADWIDAVKCLSSLPHDPSYFPTGNTTTYMPPLNTSSSYYDDLVYLHVNNDYRVHFTGLFFPWHRWMVHNFESVMSEKCGYRGSTPYWDWSIDAQDVYNSSIFQDTSFGGWGSHPDDHSVQNGAFSSKSSFKLSYPSPHTLRRKFSLHPYLKSLQPEFLKDPTLPANASFTAEAIQTIVGSHRGDFKGFQKEFESFQGPHAAVHLIIGGDMASACPANAPIGCTEGSQWAPNEPLFWLHHAMIDKVWSDWQRMHKENACSFEGGSVQRLENITIHEKYPNGGPPFLGTNSVMLGDGLFPDAAVADVLDTTGDYLCYIYG